MKKFRIAVVGLIITAIFAGSIGTAVADSNDQRDESTTEKSTDVSTGDVTTGDVSTGDVVANGGPNCKDANQALKSLKVTSNGTVVYNWLQSSAKAIDTSALRGKAKPGTAVKVDFVVGEWCSSGIVLGLASYKTEGATWATSGKQTVFDYKPANGITTDVVVKNDNNKVHSYQVNIPSCYFQVDFFFGRVLSSITYGDGKDNYGSPVNRLILADNGGTTSCNPPPPPTCPTELSAIVKNVTYTVGTVSNLTNMSTAKAGDKVRANFTIAENCKDIELSLAAYKVKSKTWSKEQAVSNEHKNSSTGKFSTGSSYLEVTVPDCYFELDFVKGSVIKTFGPATSTNYYGTDRLIRQDLGGVECVPPPTCPTEAKAALKSYFYTVTTKDGKVTTNLKDLKSVQQGDKVKVHFTIAAGCKDIQLSLISYKATSATWNEETSHLQEIFGRDTGYFDAGDHTMEVPVPGCYFQVDFVYGAILETLGPKGTNNFYGSRLIDHIEGGTTSCTPPPPPPPTCPASAGAQLTKFHYEVNGKVVAKDAIKPGDTVFVHFTVAAGCKNIELSFVSYNTTEATFTRENATKQTVFSQMTGTFNEGDSSMKVVVPNCYYQVDFVRGKVIAKFGPANSDNYYSDQGRLIDWFGGGSKCEEEDDTQVLGEQISRELPQIAQPQAVQQQVVSQQLAQTGTETVPMTALAMGFILTGIFFLMVAPIARTRYVTVRQ